MWSRSIKWNLFIPTVMMFLITVGAVHANISSGCCNPCQENNCCTDDCGFYLGGDFLYWTVNQSELDYAVDDEDSDHGNLGKGKVHYLDFDWDAGFRIFGGYSLGWDCWDVAVVYTHFCEEANGSAKTSNDQALVPTLEPPDADVKVVDKAKGDNDLDYDVVDLVFTRPFCISKCSVLHPFFGVRALWLDQCLKVEYSGGDIDDLGFDKDVIKNDSKYKAVGLRAGLGYTVSVCNGFGLYADVGGSVLAGRTDDHQQVQRFDGSEVVSDDIDIKDKQYTSLFGYQIGVGASYETCYCDWVIKLSIGYEMNQWLNTPRLRRWVDGGHGGSNEGMSRGVTTSATDGNLLLHGLIVKAGMEF